ncbi:hypothetical protein NIES3275_20800 [Microchaete diplosiphon NIES-3275]|nr:hypothetical protein NIES3275_20800 [Microchaete diplosiphon NIES-3275]
MTNVIGLSINERSSIENIGSFTTNVIGLSINERSSIENIGSFTTNVIGLSINERSFVHNQRSFTTNEVSFIEKAIALSMNKGFPRNKLFHLVGRASCPRHNLGGQDVHPTINTGIFFYLEVPKGFPRNKLFYLVGRASCQWCQLKVKPAWVLGFALTPSPSPRELRCTHKS